MEINQLGTSVCTPLVWFSRLSVCNYTFYLIDQNEHKSFFVIYQLLDLLKHLSDQLTAL